MLLDDDVVTEGKPEARAFTRWLGGEERIEYLFSHIGRHAGAIVANTDLDAVAEAPGPGRKRRLITISACLALRLVAA